MKRAILSLVGATAIASGLIMTQGVSGASAHTPDEHLDCALATVDLVSYQAEVPATKHTPAKANTIDLVLDGATIIDGTFGTSYHFSRVLDATTNHHMSLTVVAWDDSQFDVNYDSTTTGCVPPTQTVPLPVAPIPTAPTCALDGALVVPANTDSVKWTQDVVGTGPGTYVLTAHTTIGYTFPDGTRGPVNFTVVVLPKLAADSEACYTPPAPPQHSKLARPGIKQPYCDGSQQVHPGSFTVPADTEQIHYYVSNNDASWIEAVAQPGYDFAQPLPHGWLDIPATAVHTEEGAFHVVYRNVICASTNPPPTGSIHPHPSPSESTTTTVVHSTTPTPTPSHSTTTTVVTVRKTASHTVVHTATVTTGSSSASPSASSPAATPVADLASTGSQDQTLAEDGLMILVAGGILLAIGTGPTIAAKFRGRRNH
jgi:hypothetical protein